MVDGFGKAALVRPVGRAVTEVPLAKVPGAVASTGERVGEGPLVGAQQRPTADGVPNAGAIAVVAGEKAGAGGGAGGADVVVGEAHGLLVEAIEAGRADCIVAVAAQVAVALVVGEDEDDVGARSHGLLFLFGAPGFVFGAGFFAERVVLAQVPALGQLHAAEVLPLGVGVGLCGQFGGELGRDDGGTVVVGNDDVARHDQGIAAGDGHVDREGDDVGLGVEIGGRATQPKPDIEVFEHLGEVADAAVDDRADAAAPHEEGEHHLAEDPAVQVATGIDDDDVARLGVVEGVTVKLFFRVGVFIDCILVFALGHKLQGQGWADDVLARGAGDRALDVGVADAQAGEFASGRGAANAGELGDEVFRGALDVVGFDHDISCL